MIIKADFHTHSDFSGDGKGSIEDNVKAAIEKGLNTIAITDHGPAHKFYGLKVENYRKMRGICDEMNQKYPEIKVLLGMEANILNTSGDTDISDEILEHADILLAGFHYGMELGITFKNFSFFRSNVMAKRFSSAKEKAKVYNTISMISAMERYKLLAITHPGAKGPFDVEEVATAARDLGVALEINARHSRLNVDEIIRADEVGCRFIINSDAHKPKDIGRFDEGIKRAKLAQLEDYKVINSSYYYV